MRGGTNDDVHALYNSRSTSVGDKVKIGDRTFQYLDFGETRYESRVL